LGYVISIAHGAPACNKFRKAGKVDNISFTDSVNEPPETKLAMAIAIYPAILAAAADIWLTLFEN